MAGLPDTFDTKYLESACAEYVTRNRDDWSIRTTRRRLSTYRSLGRYLGCPEFLSNYKSPPKPPDVAHPVNGLMDGVRRMVEVSTTDTQRALVALCGFAGLRISEARAVRPSHFHFKPDDEGNLVCWLVVRGKGFKERWVPISDEAFFTLKPRVKACEADDDPLVPIGDRNARKMVTRLGSDAGLGQVSSHDLRHTCGTVWVKIAGIRTAQELLGHSSPVQTAGYSHVDDDEKRKAVNAV